MSQIHSFLESKLNYFFNNTFLALIVIGIISLAIRITLFPTNIPLTLDALTFFWYATDISILGHFPNGYGFANNGWPLFLSFFFSIFHFDNFLSYMNMQRGLSVTLSLLTIIHVYLLCRKFFDKPLSILGSVIFAFEPRLILNSLLGLTDTLYILLVAISLVLFFSSSKKLNYVSFGIVGIASVVRGEGLFLFFPLIAMFLIRTRKEKKLVIRGLIAVSIFILILIPVAELRIKTEGTDALSGRILEGSQIILTKSHQSGLTHYVATSLENIIKLTGWSLIPIFILFVPIGIILIFRDRSSNNITIIVTTISMMLPVLYGFSSNPDTRYIYPLYPLLIILSLFTIKKIRDKVMNHNTILLWILIGILVSSCIYLDFKKFDNEHQREAFVVAQHAVSVANGINDYYPEESYIVVAEMPKDWPQLKSSIDFHVHAVSTQEYDSLEKYIESSKNNGLTHLVLDGNKIRPSFLNDVYYHDEKYPYLTKVYDSIDDNLKYHVKIYKIDYSKFEQSYVNPLK